MSNFSRTACSLAPAYFHHWRSKPRISRSRSDSSPPDASGLEPRALAASICRLLLITSGGLASSGPAHRRRQTTTMSFGHAFGGGVSRHNGAMPSVSLPRDLPPLDVTPGPTTAEPLPPDRPVRWGILATGKIASAFAANLRLLPEARIAAVGARRLESAEAVGAEPPPAHAYGDYKRLVSDPDVDVVYVASPHSLHREHV